jgi:hypothetical protein
MVDIRPDFKVDKDWAVRAGNGYWFASHLVCPELELHSYAKDSWLATESPKCWYCHVKVPDGVQALVILVDHK